MNTEAIEVRGARTHNLKNLSVDVPKNKLVVCTGPSGAGKSSLVFDTIHTEAQRQLVETFSSFARRRLPKMTRPPVEALRNLGVTIVVDQKPLGRTLRSTVGTATEINDYLRMLYSRFAEPFIGPSFYFSFNNPEGMCPECSGLGKRIRIDPARFYDPALSLTDGALLHPDYKVGAFFWRELLAMELWDVNTPLGQWPREELDRFFYTEPIPVVKKHGASTMMKNFEGVVRRLERYYANRAEDERDENEKNAYDEFLVYGERASCGGTRLNERARKPRIGGLSIDEACGLELVELETFLDSLRIPEAEDLVGKMRRIARHLAGMGAGYLSLDRAVSTLSGGESQRVKLARRLDCDLSGLVYALDEPTAGLHPSDARRVADTLRLLRDAGNTVLVVEHDLDVIREADWVIEIGPKAGSAGGELLYSGTPEGLACAQGPTADALRSRATMAAAAGVAVESAGTGVADSQPAVSRARRKPRQGEAFSIRGAHANNLKNVSLDIPRGLLVGLCGPAGSGKSTLLREVFVPAHPEAVVVAQTAIGRTSRGTPGTYLGVFDLMRKEFAKATGADASLLSFNSKGACPKCNGAGHIVMDMNFLDDVRMLCDECGGRRYRAEALAFAYKGKTIADVLDLTAEEAAPIFEGKEIRARLARLADVGLGYLPLGQTLSSLSGGEAQRLKLAAELEERGNIYVLDEPTSGLHSSDVDRLLRILNRLVDRGNSVILIEHDVDTLAACDWLVDMGPSGGTAGGRVLSEGTPEQLAADPVSVTGPYLRPLLGMGQERRNPSGRNAARPQI